MSWQEAVPTSMYIITRPPASTVRCRDCAVALANSVHLFWDNTSRRMRLAVMARLRRPYRRIFMPCSSPCNRTGSFYAFAGAWAWGLKAGVAAPSRQLSGLPLACRAEKG